MDPTTQENQSEQKKQGGISQEINALNNFRDLNGPLGKTGSRTAIQAGKLAAQGAAKLGTFLVSNPVGWIILAIIVVVIITFIIVLSLGAPALQTGENPAQTEIPATTTAPLAP